MVDVSLITTRSSVSKSDSGAGCAMGCGAAGGGGGGAGFCVSLVKSSPPAAIMISASTPATIINLGAGRPPPVLRGTFSFCWGG